MYGYIYLITNLINGKKYIGKHKSNTIDDGYMGSGTLLIRSQKKHGLDNFKKELLAEANSNEELSELEIQYIETHDAVSDPNYYNLAAGGSGGDTSAHLSREAVSARQKLIWENTSEEKRKIISRKRSESFVAISENRKVARAAKISSALTGRPKSEDHRKKIAEARKGVPMPESFSINQSIRNKAAYAAGTLVMPVGNRGNKDFRHSEESKELQRVKHYEARERAIAERGSYLTAEGKAAQKESRDAFWSSEAGIKRREELSAPRSQEFKDAISAASTSLWQDDSYREKQSQARKEAWVKRKADNANKVNPVIGSKWYFNEKNTTEVMLVKPGEIAPEGWSKGRGIHAPKKKST